MDRVLTVLLVVFAPTVKGVALTVVAPPIVAVLVVVNVPVMSVLLSALFAIMISSA